MTEKQKPGRKPNAKTQAKRAEIAEKARGEVATTPQAAEQSPVTPSEGVQGVPGPQTAAAVAQELPPVPASQVPPRDERPEPRKVIPLRSVLKSAEEPEETPEQRSARYKLKRKEIEETTTILYPILSGVALHAFAEAGKAQGIDWFSQQATTLKITEKDVLPIKLSFPEATLLAFCQTIGAIVPKSGLDHPLLICMVGMAMIGGQTVGVLATHQNAKKAADRSHLRAVRTDGPKEDKPEHGAPEGT